MVLRAKPKHPAEYKWNRFHKLTKLKENKNPISKEVHFPRRFISPRTSLSLSAYRRSHCFQILSSWKYWLTGVASIVLGLFGFLGNFFAIAVLWDAFLHAKFI